MVSEALRSSLKIPELRSRLIATLGFLALYRLGCFIPVPGVSTAALASFWSGNSGGVFGFINVFSGGALERFSLFSLGIMPYINASIIIQLLTVAFPDSLGKIAKEGESGRRQLTQWTRIGTVVLALLQGGGFTYYFAHQELEGGLKIVPDPSVTFWLTSLVTLMAGTAFLMWIGERISESGIGNGISVLIAAGILAEVPGALTSTYQLVEQGEIVVFTLAFVGAVVLLAIGATVMITVAVRKIPIQYAKRIQGRRVYGGVSQFLPLRVNAANVIPVIFAQALLSIPSIVSGWIGLEERGGWLSFFWNWTVPGRWEYNVFFSLLILGFTFVYTSVIINVEELADGLKRQGGSIPGIRPGRPTAEFIEKIVLRITLWGGIFLAALCLLPSILIEQFSIPFYFGGTALIIVVGVCLDTVSQMESFLLMRHYEGFSGAGGPRTRGRR